MFNEKLVTNYLEHKKQKALKEGKNVEEVLAKYKDCLGHHLLDQKTALEIGLEYDNQANCIMLKGEEASSEDLITYPNYLSWMHKEIADSKKTGKEAADCISKQLKLLANYKKGTPLTVQDILNAIL